MQHLEQHVYIGFQVAKTSLGLIPQSFFISSAKLFFKT